MSKKNLRLYWGENYCSKPKIVQKVLEKVVFECLKKINQFPGNIQDETIELIVKFYHLKQNQIILGNGVDSLIHLVARSYIKNGVKVVTLSPSYEIYKTAAINYGGTLIKIPVGIGQILKSSEIIKKIKETKLFFLAYPNNPTGQYCLSIGELKKLLKEYKGLIIVDECYFGIGNQTVISLISRYGNLIVLRSFSKSIGLAGLRFGYLVADKKIISWLKKFYNEIELDPLNIFSCLTAQAILPYINSLTKNYIKFKKEFINKLMTIKNVELIPTQTSFILIKLKYYKNIEVVTKKLEQRGIFVKNTKYDDGFPSNILMFAVPKKEEWNYFLNNLERIIN